uniref:Uncharacterized protein n=1 Tax=Arundo donax TaxID=35708 RepID=A0A0A9BF70_ARUDO
MTAILVLLGLVSYFKR